jgi:hypothetical protein
MHIYAFDQQRQTVLNFHREAGDHAQLKDTAVTTAFLEFQRRRLAGSGIGLADNTSPIAYDPCLDKSAFPKQWIGQTRRHPRQRTQSAEPPVGRNRDIGLGRWW